VELVSQVVRVRGELRHACSEDCRKQILAESDGARLGAMTLPPAPVTIASATPPPVAPVVASPVASLVASPVVAPPVLSPPVPIGVPAPPPSPVVSAASAAAPRASKRIHAPQRLAIFNHKGGTGKTTTSVSLAAGLAARGLRVLLVDTDSQGNVSVSLNVKAERTLYHVLVMGMRATDVAVKVRENLDMVISNETLAAAELYLAGKQNRDRVLRDRLASAFDAYDIVLLDCSPSLSLMNQNALVVADGIIVPVACDFLSLVGVRQVIKTVKNVNQLLHHPVQIHGVLPTFYDARARICRDAVQALEEHFGDRVMPPIRQATRLKEAPAQGKTIYEYAPESNAAHDYATVVDLLVDGPTNKTSRPRAVGE
jgi:chromosome partitioning protein